VNSRLMSFNCVNFHNTINFQFITSCILSMKMQLQMQGDDLIVPNFMVKKKTVNGIEITNGARE
jgi:hypothetical protein